MHIGFVISILFNLFVIVYVHHVVKEKGPSPIQKMTHLFSHHKMRPRLLLPAALVVVVGIALLPSSAYANASSWFSLGNGDIQYTDGNVGIGRSPSARLHVDGGDAWIWNNGNNPRILIGDNANSNNWGSIQWDSNEKVLALGYQADTDLLTLGNRMDIGGHVNIKDDNGAAVIYFPETGAYPNFYIRSDDDPNSYEFDSERFFVGSNGKVGIGTTNPQATLDVDGELVTSGGINAGGNPGSTLMWKVFDYEATGDTSGMHFVPTGIDFDKVVSFTCQRVLSGSTMWDQSLAEDQFDDTCELLGAHILYDLGNTPSFETSGHIHFKAVIQYQE